MVITSWYNVSQSTPYGSFSSTDNTVTYPTTISLPASSASGRVVNDFVGVYPYSNYPTAVVMTAGVGQTQTQQYDDSSNSMTIASSYITASGSTTTMTWKGASGSATIQYAQVALDLEGASNASETITSPVASISNNCTLTLEVVSIRLTYYL